MSSPIRPRSQSEPLPPGSPLGVEVSAVPGDDANEAIDVRQLPDIPSQLGIKTSTGRSFGVDIPEKERPRCQGLFEQLKGNATVCSIDLTNALITRDGVTNTVSSQESGAFQELRKLVGKIFKPKGDSPFIWTRSFSDEKARAFQNAPESFSWSLKIPEFDFKELSEKPDEQLDLLKRHCVAQTLINQMVKRLDQIKERLLGERLRSKEGEVLLHLDSRLQKIEQAKQALEEEINPSIVSFEATHPLTQTTEETLKAKKQQALEAFKKRSLPRKAWEGVWKKKTDFEEAAKELALAGIEGRKEYLEYCQLLETYPKRDAFEHLVIRLMSRIAVVHGNSEEVLEGSFFRDTLGAILLPEDADELREVLKGDCGKLTKAYESLTKATLSAPLAFGLVDKLKQEIDQRFTQSLEN